MRKSLHTETRIENFRKKMIDIRISRIFNKNNFKGIVKEKWKGV